MSVAEIQNAILTLPDKQKSLLAEWLYHLDKAVWDIQIAHDFSKKGKGMKWLKQIDKVIRKGRHIKLGSS